MNQFAILYEARFTRPSVQDATRHWLTNAPHIQKSWHSLLRQRLLANPENVLSSRIDDFPRKYRRRLAPMSLPTLLITPQTSVETIRARFQAGDGTLKAKIAGFASARDLMELARAHAREAYGEQLAQVICRHPGMSGRDLAALDRIFPRSLGLAHSIATSGKAPVALLRRYAARRDRHLREHAKLALLSRRLDGAGVRKFREVLARSGGGGPSAMARRSIVLMHPSAPAEVLADLLRDPVDSFAREAARRLKTLVRKQHPNRTKLKSR